MTTTSYTYERPTGVHWSATVDEETGDETHTRVTPRAGRSAFLARPHEDTYVVKNARPPATAYKPISFDGLSGTAQVLLGLLFAHPVTSVDDGIAFLSKQGFDATPKDIRSAAERYVSALP